MFLGKQVANALGLGSAYKAGAIQGDASGTETASKVGYFRGSFKEGMVCAKWQGVRVQPGRWGSLLHI